MYQVNTMSAKATKAGGEKGKRVNISVDPADYEAFESLAAMNGVSSAMLIRLAMKHYLRTKRGKNALVA